MIGKYGVAELDYKLLLSQLMQKVEIGGTFSIRNKISNKDSSYACILIINKNANNPSVAKHMTSQIRHNYNHKRLHTTDSEWIVCTTIVRCTGVHAERAHRITTNYVHQYK